MKKIATDRTGACAFVRSKLINIAEKEIEGAKLLDIQNHLDSCPECALIVQQFVKAWKSAAPQEEILPSAIFLPNLIKRIEAYEEQRSARKGILWAVQKILRPAALAALFLAGIFDGTEMGKEKKIAPASEESFTDQYLGGFEDFPPGSVADFYITYQNSRKEDPK